MRFTFLFADRDAGSLSLNTSAPTVLDDFLVSFGSVSSPISLVLLDSIFTNVNGSIAEVVLDVERGVRKWNPCSVFPQ